MNYSAKLPKDSVNVSKENPFFYLVKITIGLGIFAFLFYGVLTFSINIIVSMITPEQEKKLIKFSSIDFDNSSFNEHLNIITKKLTLCTDLPYEIKTSILEIDTPNAFAVPGGKIYVTRGLLNKIESENELAFILGHEIGHFKNRDHLRVLGHSLVISFISVILGDYGMVLNTPLSFGKAKYSQSAELDADKFGLESMNCAYGNVSNATGFFEKMNDKKTWKYFLSTHPNFDERIEKIQNLINAKGFKTNGTIIPLNI